MAAYLYYAPLMSLLCADASDDASVHSDCIVPQSFSINKPFLIHFNVHTLEINKNSYFYSVSRILCFDVIFFGVLQHVINTITLVLSLASTSVSSGKKFYHTSLCLHQLKVKVLPRASTSIAQGKVLSQAPASTSTISR